jgi:hypothetical protein
LNAREFERQKTEVRIVAMILNIYFSVGKPVSRKV